MQKSIFVFRIRYKGYVGDLQKGENVEEEKCKGAILRSKLLGLRKVINVQHVF